MYPSVFDFNCFLQIILFQHNDEEDAFGTSKTPDVVLETSRPDIVPARGSAAPDLVSAPTTTQDVILTFLDIF